MTRVPRRNTVLVGDVRDQLAGLPDASVDTVITSPPYVALRNYGMAGQIGATPNADVWVSDLREVGRHLARVLKPSGSWWLNLGDSYSRHPRAGAPAKSLLMAPERLALALIEDGWTIRNKVIWAKTNPMPASVADRLACTWEVIYFLVRSRTYHFDLDAIRVPHRSANHGRPTVNPHAVYPPAAAGPPSWAGPLAGSNAGLARLKAQGLAGHPLGKNPGDVWTMATANFRGEHFAVFPTNLVRTPLLATCPAKACARCGTPWQRERARTIGRLAVRGELHRVCRCRAGTVPGVVLDPFFGTGTVGVVAETHGRDWVGIELNPKFARLAEQRVAAARTTRSAGDQEPSRVAA
jgi:hypothetical protein